MDCGSGGGTFQREGTTCTPDPSACTPALASILTDNYPGETTWEPRQDGTGTLVGAGGADGGADLSGKDIPAAFGHVFGVPAIYLGTIGARHSYMVSGGRALPIAGIDSVYDRGELIPQVAFPPSTGQCSIDLATGIVTLGG